jgi:hypothetical protein
VSVEVELTPRNFFSIKWRGLNTLLPRNQLQENLVLSLSLFRFSFPLSNLYFLGFILFYFILLLTLSGRASTTSPASTSVTLFPFPLFAYSENVNNERILLQMLFFFF